jgi:hypothetical protein
MILPLAGVRRDPAGEDVGVMGDGRTYVFVVGLQAFNLHVALLL